MVKGEQAEHRVRRCSIFVPSAEGSMNRTKKPGVMEAMRRLAQRAWERQTSAQSGRTSEER